jgi:hypothetical protein
METVYAAIIVIGLLVGSLLYVVYENWSMGKRNTKQLDDYEKDLTIKLIVLINQRDAILDHQYVCTGETYIEALDRIERQLAPLDKQIADVSAKLTYILIEKL